MENAVNDIKKKEEKKSFLEFNLTWAKLIIFSVVIGIIVGIIMSIPGFDDTSFQDIGTTFEWWILFGTIIIYNSKSHLDSGLKCIVFFLISQPIIYFVQVPFYFNGFEIFNYYPYWFKITLLTFPMGFIGYEIRKNNIISCIILSSMTCLLALHGIGFFKSAYEKPYHHLLSGIYCFVFIVILIFGVLRDNMLRLLAFAVVAVFTIAYFFYSFRNVETDPTAIFILDSKEDLGIDEISPDWSVILYGRGGKGEIFEFEDKYNVRINIIIGEEYVLSLTSPDNVEYEYDLVKNKQDDIKIEKR